MLNVVGLTFGYESRPVLNDLALTVSEGEIVGLVGASGSGKSSLLRCVAGLIRPSSGSIQIAEDELVGAASSRLSATRRTQIGMVAQSGALVPELTLRENCSLPLRLNGERHDSAAAAALRALEQVGLAELVDRMPSEVSGGEMQRAAIARSLVHSPRIVLADEPTGALDEENSRLVFELFLQRATQTGAAVLVATHDLTLASRTDRVLRLINGVVVSDLVH